MVRTCDTTREHSRRMLKRAVQQGRSEGPKAYPLGYVEGLSDARTPLADCFSILLGRHMSLPTNERQQIQLELEGLKRTLEWTEIQREQLLDRLDLLRLDNARLQDRVEELVRQVEGLRQQQPLF